MENMFVGTFTIGQTLDRGIKLYKKIIGKVIVLFLISSALGLANMKQMFAVQDPSNPFAGFGPLYFLALLFGGWSFIIVVRYICKVSEGEDPAFGEIIKYFKLSDFLLIITSLVWAVVILISIIALVIPYFYVLNILTIGMIVVINEKKYFFGGVARTFSLTKGRWWKTLVINVVAYLIMLVPIIVSMSLFMGSIFSTAANLESAAATGMMPTSPMAIIGMILYMVSIALLWPLFITISVVHYNSLRSEKENVDLSSQVDALGETA